MLCAPAYGTHHDLPQRYMQRRFLAMQSHLSWSDMINVQANKCCVAMLIMVSDPWLLW